MGRKRTLQNEIRVTFSLEKDDYERMKEVYQTIGVSKAVRALMRQHLQSLDAMRVAEITKLAEEIDLEF